MGLLAGHPRSLRCEGDERARPVQAHQGSAPGTACEVGQGGLMAIEQLPDGRWKVDVEPIKGKRFRKTVKTKAEALRFEATCRAKVIDKPDWTPKPKDRRRLLELIDRWRLL